MYYLTQPSFVPVGIRIENDQYRAYMDREWTAEMCREPPPSELEEILGITERVADHFGKFMTERSLPASSFSCFADSQFDLVVYMPPRRTGEYLKEARELFPQCTFVRTIDPQHDMAGLHVVEDVR